ncbi:hypothetical protein C0Q70_09909 [Pomacea canaliculata]|uniref:Cilia- and flagella-associated protein 69 ARM repeats domain-containing protein n=1 Tax=Pomacea canaliculata TaxID=400727 RepID=A0A2T7PB47_POMCA|nr:hypothetical protein C0Q70_09909 [Pomacea canaliculata]
MDTHALATASRTDPLGHTTLAGTQRTTDTGPTKIPIVAHIITDDDLEILQGSKLQPLNLKRVIKLLTDPHSMMLYDRHVNALQRICRHYQKGIPMKELVQVFKILNVCADRMDSQILYEQPVVDILKLCALPYLKEKSSDELTYEQIVIESVSQLGYLMRIPSDIIRKQICRTLQAFYNESSIVQDVQHKPSSLSYNRRMVEMSDISETLVKSLALLENNLDIKLQVLSVLQDLSRNSGFLQALFKNNCEQMLRAEAAKRLCLRLMDPDPSGQLLFRSIDIIWNLLEYGDKHIVASQLNNITCISQLRDAFIFQMTQGYSHYDRQLRNDLLVISSLVAESCPDAPFILSEGHLLLALFSFVRANEKQSRPREWSVAQFEEMQLHAMSVLSSLCPLMLEDYMTCQGSTRLLLLLEWCVGPDTFGGHGNSFHGTSGRGNKKAQMRHCLRLMRSVVSTEDEVILQDLSDQGAINQLLGVLSTAFTKSADQYDAELFGTLGVDTLVRHLKTDVKLLNSGLGHHKLLLAAIDCVWCSVVGCYITEDYLLEKEGVYLLIDLLEMSPKNMHNLIVGCLLDLCENPKTVNHVLTWRGQNGSTAAHLFCEMWRNEEAEIGASRDENGAITDVTKPLMGQLQEERGTVSLPSQFPSQAIVDVSENMRAKIYSFFCKIGFTDLPGLTVDDHVTLTIIEKYLDFKIGEVWTEIMKELEMENVRPVTPDAEAMEAISRAIEERAQIVAATQAELLEAQRNQDILDEQEFYAEIRENHRQAEKRESDFAAFTLRVSSISHLKAAKKRQELSIDASRIQPKYRDIDHFHDTTLHTLRTTVFSGKHVKVETPPRVTEGERPELAPYDPGELPPLNRQFVKHLTI